MLYLLSFIFALCSLGLAGIIVKEKKSYFFMIAPVYIIMVIVLAISSQKVGVFGLYGVFGIVPFIMKFKRIKD